MTCETSAINTGIIRILTEIVVVGPCFQQWTVADSNYSDWLCDVVVCALLQREVMIFSSFRSSTCKMSRLSPQHSLHCLHFISPTLVPEEPREK